MVPSPVVAHPALPGEPAPAGSPPALHHAHRRPLGVHPVPLLGGLGAVTLLVAIILLAEGAVVAALGVLALAVGLLALFAGGVRHDPDAPSADAALTAADRAQSWAGFAAVSGRTWARATFQLLLARHHQHQLRSDLQATLIFLDEAVNRRDEQRAEALRRQAAELEQELREAERRATATTTAARHEVEQRRVTVQPTQSLEALAQESPSSSARASSARP